MSQNTQQDRGTLGDDLNDGDSYSFVVDWSIDVDATGPVDAAQQALEIMRDNNALATVFMVTDDEGRRFRIDLDDTEPEPVEQTISFVNVTRAQDFAQNQEVTP